MIRELRTTLANSLTRSADERDAALKATIRDIAEAYDVTEDEVEQLLAKSLGGSIRDLEAAISAAQRAVAVVIRPSDEGSSHDDPRG